MFYTYVLWSNIKQHFYVGYSTDLRQRLLQHNAGAVKSTASGCPWKLVYYEAYDKDVLARRREKRLKSNGNAWRELRKRIVFDDSL